MKDFESQSELCVFNMTKRVMIRRGSDTIQRTEQENDVTKEWKGYVCWCCKKGHGSSEGMRHSDPQLILRWLK